MCARCKCRAAAWYAPAVRMSSLCSPCSTMCTNGSVGSASDRTCRQCEGWMMTAAGGTANSCRARSWQYGGKLTSIYIEYLREDRHGLARCSLGTTQRHTSIIFSVVKVPQVSRWLQLTGYGPDSELQFEATCLPMRTRGAHPAPQPSRLSADRCHATPSRPRCRLLHCLDRQQ